MFIQRGHAPLHLVLLDSGLSADEKLLLLPRLLAAGAEVNQAITDGELVCICMLWKVDHDLLSLLLFLASYCLFLADIVSQCMFLINLTI